jgi:hypothetical protein
LKGKELKMKNMGKNIVRLFILLILMAGGLIEPLSAQQPNASADLAKSVIMIGDQTTLRLQINVEAETYVVWPEIRDTITRQIEVIRTTPVDTLINQTNGAYLLQQDITITSFDSGYFAIPPFVFAFKPKNQTEFQATETEAMLLEVRNPVVDLNKDIMDIKAPLKVPLTFAELWPWILAVVLLAAGIWFLFYFLKKRKKAEPLLQIRRKPVLPPHQIAFDELEKLRAKKLWQTGKIKQYHTELTNIVRTYIQSKFGIHAIEMVTSEILEELDKRTLSAETRQKVRQMLELADLVKFAKEHPLPDEEEKSMNHALDFVKETIHIVEQSVENNSETGETSNT